MTVRNVSVRDVFSYGKNKAYTRWLKLGTYLTHTRRRRRLSKGGNPTELSGASIFLLSMFSVLYDPPKCVHVLVLVNVISFGNRVFVDVIMFR